MIMIINQFEHNVYVVNVKLLIKVLETKKVYVDISTITSSYLNSLFS